MTEECLQCKEPNPEDMEPKTAPQEVSKEEAPVRCSGAMKKRPRDQDPAMEHCQKPKERTLQNCGSRKRLTVAGKKMTRHAGHIIGNNSTRNKVEQGTRTVGTLRKRLQKRHERRMGMNNLGSTQPLYPR
jgi:hypothetical protein